MKINYTNDIIIPGAVGGIELGLKAWDDKRKETDPNVFEFEPIAPYVIAGTGTIARVADMLPKYDEPIKMAVAASMPRVITGLYDWVRKEPVARKVSRNRSTTRTSTRITARTPEFDNIRIV